MTACSLRLPTRLTNSAPDSALDLTKQALLRQGLVKANHEEPTAAHSCMHALQQVQLRGLIEIRQRTVAAHHHIRFALWQSLAHIHHLEVHAVTMLRLDTPFPLTVERTVKSLRQLAQ